jgi:O-antigen ligase
MKKKSKEVQLEPPSPLFRLRFKDLKKYFLRERVSFILICIYSFLEYVRPQGIYGPLKGLPVSSVTLGLTTAAVLMDGTRGRKMTKLDMLLGLMTVVVLASCLTAYQPSRAFEGLRGLYVEWIIIIMLTATIVNTEARFLVYMLLWMLWSFKMSQHGVRSWAERGFSFAGWGITCAPQFFQNSGECGAQMAIFFPISLYFYLGVRAYVNKKRRIILAIIPASAAITIMASSSRGAQLALAGVLLWIVLRSNQKFKSLVYTAVAAALLYAMLPAEEIDRFRTMGDDKTSVSRKTYWKDGLVIMSEYPVLGIGLNNWLPYYRTYYNPEGEVQHNIFIQAGTETGYTGLAVLVALIVGTFTLNHKTRKLANSMGENKQFLWCMAHGFDGALVGYLIAGFFVTILWYPFFWTNLALTLALHNVTWRKLKSRQRPPPPRGLVPAPIRSIQSGHAT